MKYVVYMTITFAAIWHTVGYVVGVATAKMAGL